MPHSLPHALLGALFVSEDGKLAVRIERGDNHEAARATVWAGVGGRVLLEHNHTSWHPATSLHSEHASERLGQLRIELGVVGAGDFYRLFVVRPNPDRAAFGDKDWVAALPDSPLAELRLFPEFSNSPYSAGNEDWQSGWWYPYSTFRPATPDEEARHAASRTS